MWPLDNRDYLTVCDNHPTPYISWCALIARWGASEDPEDAEPFNPPRLTDYQAVAASPLLLHWMTLMELAREMECGAGEIPSLAHHLATAVRAGLLDRERVPCTIRGMQRLRWCYRQRSAR